MRWWMGWAVRCFSVWEHWEGIGHTRDARCLFVGVDSEELKLSSGVKPVLEVLDALPVTRRGRKDKEWYGGGGFKIPHED